MVVYVISVAQLLFNWFTKDDWTMGLYWYNSCNFPKCSRTRSKKNKKKYLIYKYNSNICMNIFYYSLDCTCSYWYCTKQRCVDNIPGFLASNVGMWCFARYSECDLLTRTSIGSLRMVSHWNHSLRILWLQFTQYCSKHFNILKVLHYILW